MNGVLVQRLDALKEAGTIAGYQRGGGPNYGLSRAPLPWLIFPVDGSGATTYYNSVDLGEAINVLQTFGPTVLTGRR
jgi:hypothetical protein